MKTPFLDFWINRRERGETLESRHKIKLTDAQQSTLVGDSDVRAALQQTRMASLLPPVGTELFRQFTPASMEQINKCIGFKKKELVEDENCLKPAPELKSGKPLPFFYGAPPPELRNTPLEDPDPFYQSQKTFVVVDRANTLSRYNAESSCFHFSPFSLFRRGAIKILNHNLFVALVCLTLVVNMFFLTPSARLWYLDAILELVFLSVYTLEAVLKILSRGFCWGDFTYLRDSWNRLDFVIITTGFFFLTIEPLWFFKALRVLKILGLFHATRRVARMFGRVLNRLWDVFFLTLLVLTVFSIIGGVLMSGSLGNKCIKFSTNSSDQLVSDSQNASEEFDYYAYINDPENQYRLKGNLGPLVCGNSSSSSDCPESFVCLQTHSNPNYGFTNFDHFGFSFLSSFRLMLRDFWENLATLAIQAVGKSIIIYFVLVWFFCTFSLTVFIVAAFVITYCEQTEEQIHELRQDRRDLDRILTALKDKVEDELPEKNDGEQKVSCGRRLCSWDCCGCWVQMKKGLQVVVLDPFFDLAIIVLLILNVCLMATEHYPMTYAFEATLSQAYLAFTIIFALEVVLKILALGPYEFFEVNWHYFDSVIALLTLLELTFADFGDFAFLRLVCALRLFRLARWWPSFLKWMRLAWAGVCSLWFLCVLLVTYFFVFSGELLFSRGYENNACRISEDCTLPRWHFSSTFHSTMSVIRALCGEWIELMWDCLDTNGFVCMPFFLALLIVGNFLILTWFWTLLMKWISNKLAPKDEEKLKASTMRFVQILKVCGINREEKPKEEESAAVEDTDGIAQSHTTSENGTQSSTLPIGEAQNFQRMKESENAQEDPENCCCQKLYTWCPALDLDKSQGCGRVWANVRRVAFKIQQHSYFNNFIFFIILVSSLNLLFDDQDFLFWSQELGIMAAVVQFVVLILFLLEMLLKWVGLGFRRYFTDGWCLLEFAVILGCVLSMVAEPNFLDPVLYTLKGLIPLRILAHIKGTKRSVNSLVKLLPSLLDVLLVAITVWLFFGIVFVNSFAGRFFYCFNETSEEIFHADEVKNRTECALLIEQNFTEVRWKNAYMNFDSISNAYLTLFSLGTMKGWIDTLYSMTDSKRVEDQPEYESSVYTFVVVPFFFLFGCFFCFIHIVKSLLDAYSALTKKSGGCHLFLSEEQMESFNNLTFSSKRPLAPCPRPQGRLRGRLFGLVSREAFEWLMQAVIWFGVLLMMIERHDMGRQEEEVLFYLNFVLLLLFLLEFILKICAFGRSYFSDGLNVVDFVVLLAHVVGMFIADLFSYHVFDHRLLHLLRLFRLSRVLHRVPGALRLRLLFAAWTRSLRAVLNLALVLFVLMYTYAWFGTFQFGRLQRTASISDAMNFETFGNSLICMFTVTTWGGWDGFILPALYVPPDCDPYDPDNYEKPSNCGRPGVAVAFFVSYLCLSSLVVLMAVLVVLVDMLDGFGRLRCDPLSVLNLESFFKTWRKFVPDSSHFIRRSELPDLCDKLKKPLRIPKPSALDLDLGPGDEVHCRDLLLALALQASGSGADRDDLRARIEEKYHEFMPKNPASESCEMTDCALQIGPEGEEEEATPVPEVIEE